MQENQIKLILTIPPSANELFTGYPKRHKSETYKNWLYLNGNKIKAYGYRITGNNWLEAHITIYTPLFYKNGNKKKQDLDNFLKPIFDILTENIPGFLDEHIKIIKAIKIDSEAKECEIVIKEIINK